MRSAVIDREGFAAIDWNDNYFKYCNFEDFSMDRGVISSDFVNCSFKNVGWHGGLFAGVNFISCEFMDCEFQGASFADARFVECILVNCKFVKDDSGGECDFARAVSYRCRLTDVEGFAVESAG